MSPVVVQLELDIRQWQEVQQCLRLPTSDEDGVLFKRVSEYLEKEKKVRCRSMKAAFPGDVDNIKELKLDCWRLRMMQRMVSNGDPTRNAT